MKPITALLFLVFLTATVPCQAQTSESLERLKGAPRVIVTDRTGQEKIGRLISWTDASIVIRSNGAERTYLSGDAVRVDLRSDSLLNGFLIGAAIGILPAFIADCSCGGGGRAGLALVGRAAYGGIGASIDALIPGRTPLWRAGQRNATRGLTFDISARDRRASVGWRFQPVARSR